MHTHACVDTHAHNTKTYKLQITTTMEASMFIMFNMSVCVCVHVCMCAWSTPQTPTHTHTPNTGIPQISKTLILFEDLKSVETPPPMGGCMVWWVSKWINQFCLKIYDLWIHPHL